MGETAKQNMARGAVSLLPTPKTPTMQGDDSEKSLGLSITIEEPNCCMCVVSPCGCLPPTDPACLPKPRPKEPVPKPEPVPGGTMRGGKPVEMPMTTTTLRPMLNSSLNRFWLSPLPCCVCRHSPCPCLPPTDPACLPKPRTKEPVPKPEPVPEGTMQGGIPVEMPL